MSLEFFEQAAAYSDAKFALKITEEYYDILSLNNFFSNQMTIVYRISSILFLATKKGVLFRVSTFS